MGTPRIDRIIHRHTHVCIRVYIHIYMPTNMYAHDSLSIASIISRWKMYYDQKLYYQEMQLVHLFNKFPLYNLVSGLVF